MDQAKTISEVALDGHHLTLEDFVAVARYGAPVRLTEEALAAIRRSRDLAEKIMREDRVAYGITTGFGDFANVAVPEEMSSQLSTNLILSHCVGTGEPYSEEEVRGMMLLRANALCAGVSGVRPVLVQRLAELLNRHVTPWVPQKGSLGASGDLAPLSHMGLVLLGRGQAYYRGELLPGGEALRRAGIQPLDTLRVAKNLRLLTEGCEILQKARGDRVQDAYALRCMPHVHGAVRDALEFIRSRVEIELNAVTDNPLMFLEDEAVISGGNFHGEPMALPFDFLGIACAELASISERRIERMVNAALSNGLTPFLTTEAGLNSGFMIVQYSAASMASENKVLAHPASVDSIPSSANQEDFVSMGTTAARKAGQILENTRSVLAYELLTACQAVDIRRRLGTHGQGLSPVHEAIFSHVREKISFMEQDRELWPDILEIERMVRTGELLDIAEELVPAFE